MRDRQTDTDRALSGKGERSEVGGRGNKRIAEDTAEREIGEKVAR